MAAGNGALDEVAQRFGVVRYVDVEAEDLAPVGIEEEGIGLADGLGEQVGGILGPHHRLDNQRIADEDVTGCNRQAHHDGLVEGDADVPGAVGGHVLVGCRIGMRRWAGQGADRKGDRQHHRCRAASQTGGGFRVDLKDVFHFQGPHWLIAAEDSMP